MAAPRARRVLRGRLAVSIPEAARLLGLHHSNLYRATKAGRVPSIMVGNRRLIPAWYILKADERPSATAGEVA